MTADDRKNVAAALVRHLWALTGGRKRPNGNGGEWVHYRVLFARLGGERWREDFFGRILAGLKAGGKVESYGRGRNRHYALTTAHLDQSPDRSPATTRSDS